MKAFQTELGVEPTGTVDAATITAFEKALSELTAAGDPSESPSPGADRLRGALGQSAAA